RVRDSASHLAEHLHEVPVFVIPCLRGRTDGLPGWAAASLWGSLFPATWSFMLAARERGLGTCWTTLHLQYEEEAAEVLGIPYDRVAQGALIPVAWSKGTDFTAGPRVEVDGIVHVGTWGVGTAGGSGPGRSFRADRRSGFPQARTEAGRPG